MRPAAAALLAAVLAASPGLAQPPQPPQPPAAPWGAPLEQDHPLVGTFWSAATWEQLTPAQVLDRATDARVLILGERHDNPDHHALQAWATEGVVAQGRRPAVVYEMMETDEQAAIDAWRAGNPADASSLGAALDWQESGWPEWPLYAPMADVALAAGLPILAGNLPQETVRTLARNGLPALDAELAWDLGLLEADAPAVLAGLTEDVRAGHCDLMPEAMLAPMATVQRARDAMMARRVVEGLEHPETDMAILITGNGHAREDRGVPHRLATFDVPRDQVLTLAPLEVQAGETDPAAYAGMFSDADGLPFDVVWFSPRADDADHCAALRERMQNGKQ